MLNEFLQIIPDQRQLSKVKHPLVTILYTAIVATIAGADDWECIAYFTENKLEWFKKYVEFPYGAPSHDTYERVFQWIDPKIFLQSFMDWTQMVSSIVKGGVIAIDGKTMRGTGNEASGKKALHVVSAWFSENSMVLGQVKTNEKSNEITAIPELLDIIDVAGKVVTIDAIGTQKDIAEKIIDKKADYVLALKANHEILYNEVVEFFSQVSDEKYQEEHGIKTHHQITKGHGRSETREAFITSKISWMKEALKDWKGLKSIGMVTYSREEKGDKITERRYFLCSTGDNPETFANTVRKHWGVESMHWILDVAFKEDSKRTYKDHGPENLSVLLKFAYNFLKKDTKSKKSMNKKRFLASIDIKYLEAVLNLE